MKKKQGLNQERLKELLEYDSEAGKFVWLAKASKYSPIKVGDTAGNLNSTGYRRINIAGVEYMEHRLVWLYHFAVFPKSQIDHKDGNRSNNKLENLRECSPAENAKNRKRMSNNTSGNTGVVVHNQTTNGKTYQYYVANWCDCSGKENHKFFSTLKYGCEEAMEMAIRYRFERIQELIILGHGYTERHGT